VRRFRKISVTGTVDLGVTPASLAWWRFSVLAERPKRRLFVLRSDPVLRVCAPGSMGGHAA
jgi:hypothetical protein